MSPYPNHSYLDKLHPSSSPSQIARRLQSLPPGARILDVGGASGTMGRLCQGRQFHFPGIEPGEILEWTLCAYVRDAAQLGLNKALIVAGHNRTEESGMKHLPKWLSTFLPDLPIFFVEAGDPYCYA